MLIKFNNIEEKIITLRKRKVIIDSDIVRIVWSRKRYYKSGKKTI